MAPLIVNITYYLKPGTEDQFWEAGKPLLDELKEDERLQYVNAMQFSHETGIVRLVEVWNATEDVLMADLSKRKHYQSFADTLKEVQEREQQVDIMTAIEGYEYMKA
ncbi:hypothetical protein BDV96DRAFT_638508 [Lophiotrema nucula]|uniref:ABM domain-containing protein n=1 Tax=Lophiotrema nucula TaxID=690887 RepID=A0A6A5YFG1_9PLEO|nr:hypothetical protein BDV96DRAFT_638508 [Lophiotrema nucula]